MARTNHPPHATGRPDQGRPVSDRACGSAVTTVQLSRGPRQRYGRRSRRWADHRFWRWRLLDAPLAGITVVALEQVVAAPTCTSTLGRPRRPGHQGGEPGRRRLRARLRRCRQRPGGSLRVDEPGQGVGDPRPQVRRWNGRAAPVARPGRRTGVEPGPGHHLPLWARPPPTWPTLPRPDRHPDRWLRSGGPLSHKRAINLLAQAEPGLCAITGRPTSRPRRDRRWPTSTGSTPRSRCSPSFGRRARYPPAWRAPRSACSTQHDGTMGYSLTYSVTPVHQEPVGMGSPRSRRTGRTTAHGHTVVLGTTNDREWQRLARGCSTARPGRGRAVRHYHEPGHQPGETDAEVGQWCSRHDLAHVQDVADAAGIGNSRLNRRSQVLRHPQLGPRPAAPDPFADRAGRGARLPPVIAGYTPPMGAIPGLRRAHRRRTCRVRPERVGDLALRKAAPSDLPTSAPDRRDNDRRQKVSLEALARQQVDRAADLAAVSRPHRLRRPREGVAPDGHGMKQGARLAEHENPGEATVQVLHGRVRMIAGGAWEARTGICSSCRTLATVWRRRRIRAPADVAKLP